MVGTPPPPPKLNEHYIYIKIMPLVDAEAGIKW